MKLLFLRHADALDGVDDAARPLSPEGIQDARRLGRFLKNAGVAVDAAYSSPLVRARSTAAIVLELTRRRESVELELTEALLDPGNAFESWLRHLPDADTVLLVGHAPSLAERVCRLLGVTDRDRFKLPKAGLAGVETEDRRTGRLKFFVSPKYL